jgi:dihydrofolate reductase
MGEIIVTMQISLDGVVSDPERWMTLSDEILEDHLAYYRTVDAVVFGGRTSDGLAQYWPEAEVSSASRAERALAKRLNDLPKFIFTRSELGVAWRNATAVTVADDESFVREMNRLKRARGNISVEGGLGTWHRCIRHGLFDTLWLLVHPVIAGEGDRLFPPGIGRQALRLVGARTYRNGVVGLRYRKA